MTCCTWKYKSHKNKLHEFTILQHYFEYNYKVLLNKKNEHVAPNFRKCPKVVCLEHRNSCSLLYSDVMVVSIWNDLLACSKTVQVYILLSSLHEGCLGREMPHLWLPWCWNAHLWTCQTHHGGTEMRKE